MSFEIEKFKKKLVYRSQYRGTKEMDKLIGSFVQNCINDLNLKELNQLEEFLNIDDDTLYKFYNNQISDDSIIDNKIKTLFKTFIFR